MSDGEEFSRKWHPSEMARVTPERVRAILDDAGVKHGKVFTIQRGAVRVEISAVLPKRRRRAQQTVMDVLAPWFRSDYWHSYSVTRRYRWRPWCSWVIVTDPGRQWTDSATGLDYLALLARESSNSE